MVKHPKIVIGLFVCGLIVGYGIVSVANAENRRSRVVSSSNSCGHQSYYQEYVEPQQIIREEVYYFVGQPLRIQALIEKEEQDNDYAEFKAWQRSKQKQKSANIEQDSDTCESCNASRIGKRRGKYLNNSTEKESETSPIDDSNNGPTTSNPPPEPIGEFLFVEKCSKCHSGAAPKGQLGLEADNTISIKLYKDIVKAIDSGKMPKGGPPLSQLEKDKIKSEFLSLVQE